MRTLIPRLAKKAGLAAVLGLVLALFAVPGAATAGVATAGAVLLDPFDPVPEIQFQHFGGYGCSYGCGGYDRCGGGCGYHRHHGCDDGCGYHRARCDDGCGRRDRCDDGDDCGRHARCDQDCDHHDRCREHCDRADDCGDNCGHADNPYANRTGADAVPCEGRCSDTEHWEHSWRNGDHVGREYYDRGRKERDLDHGSGPPAWYGHTPDWHDNDDDDAPPPPPAPAGPPDKPGKH
jgi:hypothetical protein